MDERHCTRPTAFPKWVGDFEGHSGYREYLHSIGIALPDEEGGDVPIHVRGWW